MSINLTRRVVALEATLSPTGKIIPIWGMKPDGTVMTDDEIEQEIAAMKAAGAPANGQFVSCRWLTEGEESS